jgi:hypothetical protein
MKPYFTKLLGPDFTLPKTDKIDESRQWFREKASLIEGLNTRDVIRGATDLYTNRLRLGHFYLFRYDPKTADTLPYYDRFPFVLILDGNTTGFTGLNLHYLPFEYRAALMDQLYEYETGRDEMSRIRITYQILKTTARLRFYKPCLRQYLNNYVTSRFVHVNVQEWDVGMFLPLQKFIKKSDQFVQRDSVRKIRNPQ